MIGLLFAASIWTLVPYEPSYDCAIPHNPSPVMIDIDVTVANGIRWNGQRISRETFDSYVAQEYAKKLDDRDKFRVYRDADSASETEDLIRELSRKQIPFGKNCVPVP
jgi:hypothetical protein